MIKLLLLGILSLGLIIMWRFYYFHFQSSRLRSILHFSLFFVASLFLSSLRIFFNYELCLLLSPVFMGTCCYVLGPCGEGAPHSENPQASSSEAPNRNEAGPSNPGPRESNYPWNSFPSVPSDLQALPEDSVPSVPSLPSIASDYEVEQPAIQ